MSLVYENRAVLFLDILGFSDLVQSGKEHRLLGALQHVQGRALEVQQQGKMNFTAFSDCVVVSAPFEDGLGALRIIRYAKFLALDLLARRLLTRGAVVMGQLYHEGDIVLGPALIDAYRLESKKALYPRILVTKSLRESVARWLQIHHSSREEYFRQDFDGSFHVDLFEETPNLPETYWGNVGPNGERPRASFRDSSLVYIERIFEAEIPPDAAEKYAWLAHYFFEKCADQQWPLPENLPIAQDKRERHAAGLRDQISLDAQE